MMTTTMICDGRGQGDIEAVGEFLAEYASWLWGCGATYMRIEKNVSRMACSYGCSVELTVLSRHLTVAVSAESGGASSKVFCCAMRPCGISFEMNTALSALSWRIRDNSLPLDEACRRLRAITAGKSRDGWHVLILTSLANASFCRLFGGDASAMAVVFAATLAGYYMKQRMLAWHVDTRVVFFLCAVISSAISAGAVLFGWGQTPEVATATSVLYLIPGVMYIDAAADLIDRRYVCSFCRCAEAAVLTACLSTGLFVGLWLTDSVLL